jgi:hypothetical protein
VPLGFGPQGLSFFANAGRLAAQSRTWDELLDVSQRIRPFSPVGAGEHFMPASGPDSIAVLRGSRAGRRIPRIAPIGRWILILLRLAVRRRSGVRLA